MCWWWQWPQCKLDAEHLAFCRLLMSGHVVLPSTWCWWVRILLRILRTLGTFGKQSGYVDALYIRSYLYCVWFLLIIYLLVAGVALSIQRILSVQYTIPDYVHISVECRHLLSRIFVANPAKVHNTVYFWIEIFKVYCFLLSQFNFSIHYSGRHVTCFVDILAVSRESACKRSESMSGSWKIFQQILGT